MVRSKAPIRYITQSGVTGVWAGDSVAGGGGNGGETGAGGGGGVGAELVTKAPTALQALWVSELTALTFQ